MEEDRRSVPGATAPGVTAARATAAGATAAGATAAGVTATASTAPISIGGLPMEDTVLVEDTAEFFRVLGDATRVRLLWLLEVGEKSVGELAEALALSLSAVSHQLRLLRASALVTSRREGKNVFYRLADDHIRTIVDMALEHLLE